MNLVLTGFMGTGKSTVGRRIADLLRVPFFDVDDTIKRQAGQTIAEIFKTQGEAAFRVLETTAIQELSMHDKAVIAAGGGSLLNAKNREFLEKRGIMVCLTASTGTLLDRLKDDLTRPLIAGENPQERIERLQQERQQIYSMCPIQIDTDGKTIDQVAQEVVAKIASRWKAA
jgi:shikimate kinase